MKFGQDLNEHLVPEWKVQYLDYKKGKKMLKKLKKKPSALNLPQKNKNKLEVDPTSTPFQDASGANYKMKSRSRESQMQDAEPGDPALFKLPTSSSNRPQSNLQRSLSVATQSSHGNNHKADTTVNDHTPLLSYQENRKLPADAYVIDKPVYLLDNDNDARQRTVPFSPQSNGSNNYLRRQSTVSKIFQRAQSFAYSPSSAFNAGYNFNSNQPGTPTEMEDLAGYARARFIVWVDDELDKVNEFYKEKEHECLERFLVLQDQIIQLNEQKHRSLEKAKKLKELRKREQHLAARQRGAAAGDVDRDTYDEDDDEDDDEDEEDDDEADDDYDDDYYYESRSFFKRSASGNIRSWTTLTKRKLRLINKFEMPSLPTFAWLKDDGKIEKQYYEEGYYSDDQSDEEQELPDATKTGLEPSNAVQVNEAENGVHGNKNTLEQDPRLKRKDYARKRPKKEIPQTNIPYFAARRQLKKAVYELYRSMELLKSFRVLNRTAFRKIIKKYDKATNDQITVPYMKKVDEAYFSSSDVLEHLMGKIESIFTETFEHGNRKTAITKLRSSEVEETHYFETFSSGLFFGIVIPMLIFTVYYALHRTLSGDLPEGKFLMQIWAGFLMISLMGCLFAVNCLVWTKFKVNYKFIFEFNPRDALDFRQYALVQSFFLFLCCVLAWFSFHDLWPVQFNGRDWPWVYLGISLGVIFCPFDVFYLSSRVWLLSTLFRLLLSGFYPVEFRDFFVGDIMCSLTYSLSNLSMFFCLYGTHWRGCLDGSASTKCGSSRSRLLGFLSTVPSIWRFLQCFRRYADTGEWFPHLANMTKYTFSMLYYMSLSLYRIDTVVKYRALLITFATINSIYSSVWDILMDWSLFQFGSENFLLRDELIFKKKWYYYFAMVIDVILRFQWVFYACFPSEIQQSAVTSFGVALAEVIRRFIWIFFRMENEHATNVHLFRASRETPLPYPVIKRRRSPFIKPSQKVKEDEESARPQPPSPMSFRLPPPQTLNEESMSSDSQLNQVPLPHAAGMGTSTATGIMSMSNTAQSPRISTPQTPYTIPEVQDYADVTTTSSAFSGHDTGLRRKSSILSQASESLSEYRGRRDTVLGNLSRILTNAHIKDFQRRKTVTKSRSAPTFRRSDSEAENAEVQAAVDLDRSDANDDDMEEEEEDATASQDADEGAEQRTEQGTDDSMIEEAPRQFV